jgi:hypothetical protein
MRTLKVLNGDTRFGLILYGTRTQTAIGIRKQTVHCNSSYQTQRARDCKAIKNESAPGINENYSNREPTASDTVL